MQGQSILVAGATGYIGRQLVPRLLRTGHRVRCLVRDPSRAAALPGLAGAEVVPGDMLKPESLRQPFEGIDTLFYLVHSLYSGERNFEAVDRRAAENAAWISDFTGVRRIVYLGGLGRDSEKLSPHLRSRHQVGEILRGGKARVTEFRAAIVIGAGSASFEMIYYLVKRLPAMICPVWVMIKTQPVAVDDVLRYLAESLERPESEGKILDIGGPDIVSYGDMMLSVARAMGLKRHLVYVPVLTPRLSSYWVNLVTPIPSEVARALIEGLKSKTVCENHEALEIFDFKPMGLGEAVRLALANEPPAAGKIVEGMK